MDNYLPIRKAARIAKVTQDQLYQQIASGTIRAIKSTGDILVNEDDIYADLPKHERPEYKRVAHLAGQKLLVSEASRKYSVPQGTISGWIKSGHIAVLDRSTRRTWIDEADIAYCAAIYHANPGQGRWLFRGDGTPYIKR